MTDERPGTEWDRLERATDFVLKIVWVGDEDKPLYKAMLVSESRASLLDEQVPFWGYEVITAEEFRSLLGAARRAGLSFSRRRPDRRGQYLIELETPDGLSYSALGAERRTLEVLSELMTALREEHRMPLRQILDRAAGVFGGEEGGR